MAGAGEIEVSLIYPPLERKYCNLWQINIAVEINNRIIFKVNHL